MIELTNGQISVAISEKGAEMHSVKGKDGMEFLWQGDEREWSDRAPTLFPVVGRLRDKTYTYKGETYSLPIHGFAPKAIFQEEKISETKAVFTLEDSKATRAVYPFPFRFSVTYELIDNSIKISYNILNKGESEMYFQLGAHPGFNLPIAKASDPKKYYLEFDEKHTPTAVVLTDDGFVTTGREPFSLIDDKILPLYPREMFIPTVFLENTSKGITLKSSNTMHSVHVEFNDFHYLALWCSSVEAPFICIEPWTGAPDLIGAGKDLTEKFAMTTLSKGESKEYSLAITVK